MLADHPVDGCSASSNNGDDRGGAVNVDPAHPDVNGRQGGGHLPAVLAASVRGGTRSGEERIGVEVAAARAPALHRLADHRGGTR